MIRAFFLGCLLAGLIVAGASRVGGIEPAARQAESVEAALDSVPDEKPADLEEPSGKKLKVKRFTDLGQAVTDAAKRRTGVFILFTAEWCPWCKKELKVFNEPEVAEVLSEWTLAVIDVDQNPKIARKAGVESLPTVQVQTVDGRVIASQNGFLDGGELIAWLNEHRETILLSGEEFVGDDPPDEETRDWLLEQFQNRNPVAREAAIHRLLKHREQAAAVVAQRLEAGPLQTRLTAWELLHEWQAPVEAIDPWRPETTTPAAFESLKTWVEQISPAADEDEPIPPEHAIELQNEISALLQTDDPAQLRVIRERLARRGRALLPFVYERLAAAGSDRDRERLTVLRYRLAAGTPLMLRWPNGLERLVEGSTEERHAAVMELTEQATIAEEGLLLELFSNPDPFVRELCLRALRAVGGSSASMALLRLLDDPSPDVRAAVLGQLAESPSPQVVAQLSVYLEKEKDPDLVVHAIRALRAINNEQSLDSLLTMFDHASWHVRAEAVEAVGASLTSHAHQGATGGLPQQAELYAAVLERLKDEDGFVVSRAVGALKEAQLASVVEPLAEAAVRKPEMANEIVAALTSMNQQQTKVTKHLKEFVAHADPRLRAAGIGGLTRFNNRSVLQRAAPAALRDSERIVRIAAAQACFELLNQELPRDLSPAEPGEIIVNDSSGVTMEVVISDDVVVEPEPRGLLGTLFRALVGGETKTTPTIQQPIPQGVEIEAGTYYAPAVEDSMSEEAMNRDEPADAEFALTEAKESQGPTGNDAELLAYYQNAQREKWQQEIQPVLATMLQSDDAQERVAAALPLVPLGQVDLAWPVLVSEIERDGETARVARVLPWLVWERRRELFELLLSRPGALQHLDKIGRELVQIKDRRAEDFIWSEVAKPDAEVGSFAAWHELMLQAYQLENSRWSQNVKISQRVLADWERRAAAGTASQRFMAACLMYQGDKERAAEMARPLIEAAELPVALRGDALQIVLLTEPAEEAQSRCVAALRDLAQPEEFRQVALGYLCFGTHAMASLRGSRIWIDYQAYYQTARGERDRVSGDWGEPPAELKPQDLRPYLSARDPTIAGEAAFLAVWIHGDRLAWSQLLEIWRRKQPADESWNRLVYRAIAVLDDESLVPLLVPIYEQVKDDYNEVKEFYWTIRSMDGPAILKLRKRIRDEVGMDQLRMN